MGIVNGFSLHNNNELFGYFMTLLSIATWKYILMIVSTYVCVSRGKKCLFFGKFGMLCFLETAVLRFALLPYYRRFKLFFFMSLNVSWSMLLFCCHFCFWDVSFIYKKREFIVWKILFTFCSLRVLSFMIYFNLGT